MSVPRRERRGPAETTEAIIPELVQPRDTISTATEMSTAPMSNPTIAPYNTGLNGVNQPNNMLFTDILWWCLGALGFLILLIRVGQLAWAKLRLVSAMGLKGKQQQFWKTRQWGWMPSLKRSVIYAPFWKKRHNREIRLSGAANMGTLPSRLQSLVLFGYLASNLAYMFVLDWTVENKYALCAEIRGRSGTLSVVSMVPLIIFAGRNNPLIGILNISFDTYNLLHRWMGRVCVLEVLIHCVAWAIVQVADDGWAGVKHKVLNDRFISSGTVGLVAMVILMLLAFSPIRHAFYESFLHTHIILALIAIICTWIHCLSATVHGGLPQTPWVLAIMVLWGAERFARIIRLAYVNKSARGFTEATVEPMPGEACRVTMHLPRYVRIKPGQHAYLRFSSVKPWENHPFSIAWFQHTVEDTGLPITEKEITRTSKLVGTTVSFIIGAHSGFTRDLYNAASANPGHAISMRAALEGPYAGHHSMDSYGHVVLIAGATGITHQISYVRHLIDGCNHSTAATRRVTLVWIVRDTDVLEWVHPWMHHILKMENRADILRIKIFVTRPKAAPTSALSNSGTVQKLPGRPNITTLLAKEIDEQFGAMCVSVCGPGGLADDVRDAVRSMQDAGTVVDFVEESFTW
ncbi:ferric reductase like transmembrane component-domain-containing protein [Podospora australis]|uniref:ferric-chelate reductase (NADPH) n=1 Tax=Podospora australis TaxID=1536484 RepID=A0AAN6WX96_9PEZI|nr:ferric reductase like transmembrane component-domain-containing protein [Podospora australis]